MKRSKKRNHLKEALERMIFFMDTRSWDEGVWMRWREGGRGGSGGAWKRMNGKGKGDHWLEED